MAQHEFVQRRKILQEVKSQEKVLNIFLEALPNTVAKVLTTDDCRKAMVVMYESKSILSMEMLMKQIDIHFER